MCVHESKKGISPKPQLNRAKECEKKKKLHPSLAPSLFLPAWKRPDDNNVENGAPVPPPLPPPSFHPATPWSLKGLHMFMAHACGMTMDSPYKSQQDHGVFQILLSEDSC